MRLHFEPDGYIRKYGVSQQLNTLKYDIIRMVEIKPTTVKIPPDLDHAVSELGFPTKTDAIRRGLELLLVVSDILEGADISRLNVEEIRDLLTVEGQPDNSPLRQAIRAEVRAALAPKNPTIIFGDEVKPMTIEDWKKLEDMIHPGDGAKIGGVQTEESPTHFAKAVQDLEAEVGPLKSAYEIPPGDIATLISIRWKQGEEPLAVDLAEILGVEEASLGRRLGEMGVADRPRVRIAGRGRVRKIPASDANRRAVEAAMSTSRPVSLLEGSG